jgi:small subunit ribosomal protein S4e
MAEGSARQKGRRAADPKLTRVSGSRETKRSNAPAFWKIPRKEFRFAVSTSPGPHPKSMSFPLGILIRDVMHLTRTHRESRSAITEGAILVDGRKIRAPNFPVGLMDIIEIPALGKSYRVVPFRGGLFPIEVSESEKHLKLCKIRSKLTGKKGRIQYGLHDGRTLSPDSEVEMSPGDTCLIEVPTQRLQNSFRMNKGALVMILKGERAGEIGEVEEVKPGSFTRGSIAKVRLGDDSSELPTEMLIVVGRERPALKVAT